MVMGQMEVLVVQVVEPTTTPLAVLEPQGKETMGAVQLEMHRRSMDVEVVVKERLVKMLELLQVPEMAV